jgi:hypothetical protein
MDPNATLKEMRWLAAWLTSTEAHDPDEEAMNADRLAELVKALDGWLSRGGFLPSAWEAPR